MRGRRKEGAGEGKRGREEGEERGRRRENEGERGRRGRERKGVEKGAYKEDTKRTWERGGEGGDKTSIHLLL